MGAKPEPWRTLSGEIAKIREQLRRLSNASPFTGTGWTIIDPGQVVQDGSVVIPSTGVLQVDGGDVVMLDEAPSGTVLFELGVQQYGDRGIVVRRDEGSVAWQVRKPFSSGDPRQAFTIMDRAGKTIGGDALLSPSGFDAPHLSMPFIPVDYTSSATAQTTSSATFVALHEHRGFRQNPALKLQLMVKCSDGTTAVEVQVFNVLGGGYLGGFLGSPAVHTITVPAGTTTFSLFEFSSALGMPNDMSAPLHLQIHARVTAGVGSVSVAPVRSIGSGY